MKFSFCSYLLFILARIAFGIVAMFVEKRKRRRVFVGRPPSLSYRESASMNPPDRPCAAVVPDCFCDFCTGFQSSNQRGSRLKRMFDTSFLAVEARDTCPLATLPQEILLNILEYVPQYVTIYGYVSSREFLDLKGYCGKKRFDANQSVFALRTQTFLNIPEAPHKLGLWYFEGEEGVKVPAFGRSIKDYSKDSGVLRLVLVEKAKTDRMGIILAPKWRAPYWRDRQSRIKGSYMVMECGTYSSTEAAFSARCSLQE